MKHELESKYEEAIRSRENMKTIIQNINDGIIILDRNGRVLMDNSAARELFGIKEETEGKKLVELIDNYDLLDFADKNLKSFTRDSEEITILYPQKRYIKCDAIAVTLSEDEEVLIILMKDVTKERELDTMRREFISNVSHELKTPLTSIHGYAETLLDDDFSDVEMAKHFLSIIEAESARMSRLISDLLDLQKMEEGKTTFSFEEVSIAEVVNYVARIVKPLSESLGVDVSVSCDTEAMVKGDFDRLVQAILNLTDNAIKYTSQKEKGEKHVYLSCEVKDGECTLSIKDTGPGIPSNAIPRLFDRFYRVDKARSRKVGGTGLGLSIVKMIVDKHNGRIDISSEEGKGTEFKIHLPILEE
ncbi:sensor histidine kinase [Mesoaciditoga lauensis]|uniref:sensor histidine kinase n=1 Tax=Mesoaciditoga lauensis TaxID=1495039 RepID=UPI003CCC411C